MEIDEKTISAIVKNVIDGMDGGQKSSAVDYFSVPGVYGDINKAIYEASKAFKVYQQTSLEKRRAMIKAMRAAVHQNIDNLARMAVEENRDGAL